MADERYNFIIGMEFSPGDSVTRALRAGQDVREVLRSILNEPLSLGKIDTAGTMRQIEQFGVALRQQLEQTMQAGIQASPTFRGMPEQARLGLTPGNAQSLLDVGRGTPGLAESQNLLMAALKKRARELDKAGTEESKAQAEVTRELIRDVEAARGVEQAERAMERAYKQMTAEQLKLVQLAMKEEAEYQKRLDTINKQHYARMKAEDTALRKEEAAAQTRSELAAKGLMPAGLGVQLPSVTAENALAGAGAAYRNVRSEATRLATSARDLANAQVDASVGLAAERVRQRGALQALSAAMLRRAEIEDEISLRERALGRGASPADRRRLTGEIGDLQFEKSALDLAGIRERAKAATASVVAAEDRLSRVTVERATGEQSLVQVEQQVKAAEQKLAAAQESFQRAQGTDRLFAPPAEELSHAQARTVAARARLALAEEKVAAGELTGEKATAAVASARHALQTAIEQEASAERNLTTATQRVAAVRQETGVRGFRDQFAQGFRGASDRPYAEQIGQAFKFSVFYGTAYKALFALTQTLNATLQEGIEFQQAMTELKLAAGESRDGLEDLAGRLGDSAVAAGAAPSQGVLVGARALGLYGATAAQGATIEEQNRVAEISARVISQMSLGSGRSPADLQNDIAAITQAFQTGAGGQLRVQDLDAYFARQFGITPGSTVQAVSEAGTVGRAAGFSQEEVTAIAADLIARTGQTPAAVAGFMAQIFSRGGEGSLTAVSARYGIDPAADLATQIAELARVYKDASDQERAQISAAFGRGKVQNAAIALLQDYSTVQGMAGKSVTEATGEGARTFNIRLGDIGAQISLMVADMKEFASELGKSGLLDFLGGALIAFDKLVEGANQILKAWNQIPQVTKDVLIGFAILAAAAKSTAVQQAIAGRAGIFSGGVIAGTGVVSRSTGAVAPLASRAGAATVVGNLAPTAAAIATIGAVVGVGLAFAELSKKSRELAAAQDSATGALQVASTFGSESTPEQFRAAAGEVAAVAQRQRDAADGFWAGLVGSGSRLFGGQSDAQKAEASARALDTEARRLGAAAALIEAHAAGQTPEGIAIAGLDADSIKAGFEAIDASGGNASDQLSALRDVLYGTADAARRAKESFDPQLYASTNATAIQEAIAQSQHVWTTTEGTGSVVGQVARNVPVVGAWVQAKYGGTTSELTGPDAMAKALSAEAVEQRLAQALGQYGSLQSLNYTEAGKVADQVLGDAIETTFPNLGKQDLANLHDAARDAITNYILNTAKNLRDALKGDGQLTKEEVEATSANAVTQAQAALEGVPETDFAGRVAAARKALRDQLKIRDRARSRKAPTSEFDLPGRFGPDEGRTEDTYTQKAQDRLDAARRNLAQTQFDEFEALRRVAQHNARSKAEVARIGQKFLRKEIAAAIRGGNQDLLTQILGQAGDGAVELARQALEDALATAIAADKVRQRLAAAAGALMPMAGLIVKLSSLAEQGTLLGMLNSLDTTLSATGTGNVYGTGSDANLPDKLADKEPKETALERAAALAAARATRSESPIAQARASILSARAAMAKAKKGTVEYYNALAQFYDARNQLTDAILDYRHNLGLLNIDITDPVAQANLAVRDALRKLRSDRGKGKDVIAADKVALQQAQADQEATAFQTRLETVQTAEQLGRISHAAYINYLQNESKRLGKIKDRTYQQQQQLNQIDQLLKEAADQMQGQWNFGDIKLPTPYQVRRYIASRSGDDGSIGGSQGQVGAMRSVVNDTKIYIDGADVGMVRRIITEVVGHPGRTTTPATRRR